MSSVNKILTIAICCWWQTSFCQNTTLGNDWLKQKFYFKVRLLSQFIDRFNYEEKLVIPSGDTASRWMNLVSLVNHEDTALTANPDTKIFLQHCFADSTKAKLRYTDSLWYAIVKAEFEYKGKLVEIELLLLPECYPNNRFGWSIGAANALILNVDTTRRNDIFINPVSHEVGFIDIAKYLLDKQHFASLFHSDYKYDKLSVLDYLVQKQELKFIQIKRVEYIFRQIPGWEFTVKEFNRNSLNSGWLISKISKK